MSKFIKSVITGVAAAAIAVAVGGASANAGGLFGEGGLIRGDIGKFMDPIEHQVLTPMAQDATVIGSTAVGAYFGGEIGGAIGAQAGNCINQAFAGKDCAGGGMKAKKKRLPQRVREPAQFGGIAEFPNDYNGQGFNGQGFNPQAFGNFCMTQVGLAGPGPMNPVGMPCHTVIGGQVFFGNVVSM